MINWFSLNSQREETRLKLTKGAVQQKGYKQTKFAYPFLRCFCVKVVQKVASLSLSAFHSYMSTGTCSSGFMGGALCVCANVT